MIASLGIDQGSKHALPAYVTSGNSPKETAKASLQLTCTHFNISGQFHKLMASSEDAVQQCLWDAMIFDVQEAAAPGLTPTSARGNSMLFTNLPCVLCCGPQLGPNGFLVGGKLLQAEDWHRGRHGLPARTEQLSGPRTYFAASCFPWSLQ